MSDDGATTAPQPRTFKPNERVIVRGQPHQEDSEGIVLGSDGAAGKYTVFVDDTGTFAIPASDLEPILPEQRPLFITDDEIVKRLRQIAAGLRDLQARLPTLLRDCETLEKAITR